MRRSLGRVICSPGALIGGVDQGAKQGVDSGSNCCRMRLPDTLKALSQAGWASGFEGV